VSDDELPLEVPVGLFDFTGPCPACDSVGVDARGVVCRTCLGVNTRSWGEW
jgi:hypothetical protein